MHLIMQFNPVYRVDAAGAQWALQYFLGNVTSLFREEESDNSAGIENVFHERFSLSVSSHFSRRYWSTL